MAANSPASPAPAPEPESPRFFRRVDWAAFWVATLVSLGVYFYTLAPTLTMEDSGELAVGGAFLGVPHPPGYPIWTMLVWIFTKLFAWVTFRGQPNPAWAIALASAVFGALASGVTAMLVCRSGADIIGHIKQDFRDRISPATEEHFCFISGVVCSLLFAFSPVNWSQCVIVEVYSLNALFLALVLLLAYMWIKRPRNNTLIILSLVFGLGLTNYQGLLLLLPALIIVVLVRDIALFRDFVVAAIPFGLAMALIKFGFIPTLSHPLHYTAFAYVLMNFLLLLLIFFFLPHGRTVALCILAAEAGVAVYAFMPLSSETNPPINWGYPRTFEGFLHAITRGQYEKISPTDIFSARFIDQVGDYLADLRGQYTLPVAMIGFLPFTAWELTLGGRRIKIAAIAIPLFLAASGLVLAEEIILSTGIPAISLLYKILICGLIGLLLVGGITLAITHFMELLERFQPDRRSALSEVIATALVILAGIAILIFVEINLAVKFAAVTAPLRQAGQTLSSDAFRSILLNGAGIVALMLSPLLVVPFLSLYRNQTQLRMSVDPDSQRWIVSALSSFLVMSLLFIALANPKGDIQDYFIQRVKFISSHALYCLWIGYGMIIGLTVVTGYLKEKIDVKWPGIVLAGLMTLIPFKEIVYNKEMIRVVGGPEQNGHDYGWQFGNYQLRGAEAMTEELSPDEEPLPNPSFPPEMGPDAVFFGGTDPGRFVPTYMIYAAAVREDVYLITQNALADNTYMSVMRDLYGDRIWIPAQPDSAGAFQRYVDDVKAGRRPPNADIRIDNGRVQISGALGVMEINGILAQMIFEHNNYRHDFYVEESYVIRWMYPYLVPHGLIMKICRDQQPRIGDDRIADDMDFWDWYSRRFDSDQKFIRDIVARKSFSKLRSAIAGLYVNANERRPAEAERAFTEARILYSLSPEANFRLAELYMQMGRTADAKRLITGFGKQDPGNGNVKDFLGHVGRMEEMNVRINELEDKRRQNKLDLPGLFELCDRLASIGQGRTAADLMSGILGVSNLPPRVYLDAAKLFQKCGRIPEMTRALDICTNLLPSNTPAQAYVDIARFYAETGQMEKMVEVLKRYLSIQPNDWKAWLDLATIQLNLKQTNEAIRALESAVRTGGPAAANIVNQDPRFKGLIRPAPPKTRPVRNFMDLIK